VELVQPHTVQSFPLKQNTVFKQVIEFTISLQVYKAYKIKLLMLGHKHVVVTMVVGYVHTVTLGIGKLHLWEVESTMLIIFGFNI
jgi:hypothetical protein